MTIENDQEEIPNRLQKHKFIDDVGRTQSVSLDLFMKYKNGLIDKEKLYEKSKII